LVRGHLIEKTPATTQTKMRNQQSGTKTVFFYLSFLCLQDSIRYCEGNISASFLKHTGHHAARESIQEKQSIGTNRDVITDSNPDSIVGPGNYLQNIGND